MSYASNIIRLVESQTQLPYKIQYYAEDGRVIKTETADFEGLNRYCYAIQRNILRGTNSKFLDDEVVNITIESPTMSWTIVKSATGWKITNNNSGKIIPYPKDARLMDIIGKDI